MNQATILACSEHAPVVLGPLNSSDGLLVSLKEDTLEFIILTLSIVISDVVEEFAFLLKDLILETARQQVILIFVEDVNLGLGLTLELVEEVVLEAWLLELF